MGAPRRLARRIQLSTRAYLNRFCRSLVFYATGVSPYAPVSRIFGLDRGTPIDRFYIEQFLERNALSIRGRVLEVAEDTYTRKYGGNRVAHSDVLHVVPGTPHATIIGNLESGHGIPDEAFDCIILTQTLQFIYDFRSAAFHLHRALAPGGILLLTVPGISQISRYDMDRWGEYWRFTSLSLQRLLGEFFPRDSVGVEAHGNILAAVSFLHGIAAEEIPGGLLENRDPDYEVLITARAENQRL